MSPLVAHARQPMLARGFVLVAVLAMLVVLSVIGSTIAVMAQRQRDAQLESQRQLQADIDMASTRSTVLYLLASQRMTFGGLTVDDRVVLSEDERRSQVPGDRPVSYMPVGNELPMDGSPVRGLGGTSFSLQDDRGLLSVNWAGPALLDRYLSLRAKPVRPVESMLNLLRDYQDPDDLYRLNSAERSEYERRGLPPPTNQALATPLELRRIMGWQEALAKVGDMQLLGSLTVVRSSQVNVNTAPLEVLRTLPGVDRSMAERVVAARAVAPFIHATGFYQMLGGIPVSEETLSLYPLGSGTLHLWPPGGGSVQVLHWTLTPRDEGGRPWREDYEFILPGDPTMGQRAARRPAAKVFAQPDAPSQ